MLNLLRATGLVASAAFVAMSVFVARPGSNYRYAALFLVPLVWAPYLLRRRIHLHPLHYALFALALLLHNLGAFGLYQRSVLGVSFDVYVHTYFGVVGGLLVYRYLRHEVPLRPWHLRVGAVLLVLGMGAVHEMMEWASTLALGSKHGMLKTEGVYAFDTQRDMFSNLCGAAFAVACYALRRRPRGRAVAGYGPDGVAPSAIENPGLARHPTAATSPPV